LDEGGVAVGAQIAIQLHCPINLLLTEEISLPRELSAIGSIAQDGSFTYNHEMNEYELDEMVQEYHSYIEQQKLEKLNKMHRLLGHGGTIRKDLLRGRHLILVSDGLKTGHTLDITVQYLKPVASEGIIVATPLASIPAVDYMHVLADDIYCLSVLDNYMDTAHYYDKDDIPNEKLAVDIIERIVLNWR
jgi:predicted phosphoribosyltransferase